MKSKYLLLLCILFNFSCGKEWLDIKRDKKLVVPNSYRDLQALLNYSSTMNQSSPSLGVISADDHYVEPEKWRTLASVEARNAYVWKEDIYEGTLTNNWSSPYQQVFYSNLILEGVEKLKPKPSELDEWNDIKGSALFYRSWAFHNLAMTFCADYNVNTAKNELGIPLKVNSYVKDIPNRFSLYETYERIINDLNNALLLVPKQTIIKTRPNKSAVHAMLARVFLYMKDYDLSLSHAEKALGEGTSELMNYSSLDIMDDYPFKLYNEEVIFQARILSATIQNSGIWKVDTNLYNLYEESDLRKKLFFDEQRGFKGSYNENRYFFSGLAVDEIYLIIAECEARNGNLQIALNFLNTLLKNRYEKDKFIPIQILNKNKLLEVVLMERRKQLIFRGLRWADLKRLNNEEHFKNILIRDFGEVTYVLEPNDPRYVFALPDEVIQRNNMEQNNRLE